MGKAPLWELVEAWSGLRATARRSQAKIQTDQEQLNSLLLPAIMECPPEWEAWAQSEP